MVQTSIPVPKQARSRDALQRFLLVGEELVATNTYDEVGIAELCTRADSSVGTFYRLIGDKDLLLAAVHDRFIADARLEIRAVLSPSRHQGADLESVLQTFVELLVRIYTEREGLVRALIVRSSTDPEFRERIGALRSDIRDALGTLVLPRTHEIHHENPIEAFTFAVKLVVGTLNHATVVQSLEQESSEDLVRELTRVLVRYLEIG